VGVIQLLRACVAAGVLQSTVCSFTDKAKESPVVQACLLENCMANDERPYFAVKWQRQYVLHVMMDTAVGQEET